MPSSFERRNPISAHHDLWIELGRIELAIEKSLQDSAHEAAPAQNHERQLHLREALAHLDA